MRSRSSIIWTTSREKLIELVNSSNSISEILRKLGYVNIEGNHRTMKDRLSFENIDLAEMNKRGIDEKIKKLTEMKNGNTKCDKDIFCEGSDFSRYNLKNRIIKNNLIKYECRDCGNDGHWKGKIISLHLEHINGIPNDNRLENLCFLCPNCHSQTETYAGKKVGLRNLSVARTCPNCGCKKDRQADYCRKCYRLRSGETESRLPPSEKP
jgi:Zn finger protein HypA/HybF involved in hydrogenase expression